MTSKIMEGKREKEEKGKEKLNSQKEERKRVRKTEQNKKKV